MIEGGRHPSSPPVLPVIEVAGGGRGIPGPAERFGCRMRTAEQHRGCQECGQLYRTLQSSFHAEYLFSSLLRSRERGRKLRSLLQLLYRLTPANLGPAACFRKSWDFRRLCKSNRVGGSDNTYSGISINDGPSLSNPSCKAFANASSEVTRVAGTPMPFAS